MFKVIWLLKRKPGISRQQFREHFERTHVPLAHKYLGHLFAEYRRSYPTETFSGGDPRQEGGGFGPVEWEHDCISEWVMHDEAAFNELNRIMADPVIGKAFRDDEENFLDRKGFVMIKCDEVNTGTGDGHGALARTGTAGAAT
jgi:hypothetical protein